MISHSVIDILVLLLKVAMMRRAAKGNKPEAKRSFVQTPYDFGELKVAGGFRQKVVEATVEHH